MIHWPASRMLALSQRFIETVLLLLCELKHKNRLQCRTLSLSEIPRMRLKTDRVSPECVSAAIGLFNNRVKCVHVCLWFLVEPGSHLQHQLFPAHCASLQPPHTFPTSCILLWRRHFSWLGKSFSSTSETKKGRVHDECTSSLAAYRRGWQVEPLLKVL